MGESHATSRQAFNIRRPVELCGLIEGRITPAKIVSQDEDYVWSRFRAAGHQGRKGNGDANQHERHQSNEHEIAWFELRSICPDGS